MRDAIITVTLQGQVFLKGYFHQTPKKRKKRIFFHCLFFLFLFMVKPKTNMLEIMKMEPARQSLILKTKRNETSIYLLIGRRDWCDLFIHILEKSFWIHYGILVSKNVSLKSINFYEPFKVLETKEEINLAKRITCLSFNSLSFFIDFYFW